MKRFPGFVTLLSVLVLAAVCTSIAVALLMLGLGSSKSSYAVEQSNEAKGLANACAEEALKNIRDLPYYAGTGNKTLGFGTCTFTVIVISGENRTITASGTVGTIIRKLSISLDKVYPNLHITSWQEVAN